MPSPPDRQPPPEPVTAAGRRTRAALLAAGQVVAERTGLAGLSVSAVVAEAGVAKGTFYVHFADRDHFLVALREQFHGELRAAVRRAASGVPPGRELLAVATDAYLECCLRQRAVKALVRSLDPEICGPTAPSAADAGGSDLSADIAANLRAAGVAEADVVGRLFESLVAEVAVIEQEAGGPSAPARAAISAFLAGLAGEAAGGPAGTRTGERL